MMRVGAITNSREFSGEAESARFSAAQCAEYLWLSPETLISDDTLQGVHAVAAYLKTHDLVLQGVKADGNCYCRAFLGSYATLRKRRIPCLDREENKVACLRGFIAARHLASGRTSRVEEIKRNGEWMTSAEGDLLANALSIHIRTITVNKDKSGHGMIDMLAHPDKTKDPQVWDTIHESERPEEYILIVDLGGHFVFARPGGDSGNLASMASRSENWAVGTHSDLFRADIEALVLDPIYAEPMVDPQVDQHGHTFDRSTVNALVAKWKGDPRNAEIGEGFVCPLTYEWAKVRKLRPNFAVQAAAGQIDSLVAKHDLYTQQTLTVQRELFRRDMVITMNEVVRQAVCEVRKEYQVIIANKESKIATLENRCVVLGQQSQDDQRAIDKHVKTIGEQKETINEKNATIDGLTEKSSQQKKIIEEQSRTIEGSKGWFYSCVPSAAVIGAVVGAVLSRKIRM